MRLLPVGHAPAIEPTDSVLLEALVWPDEYSARLSPRRIFPMLVVMIH
jgi:hypothetical protein